MNKPIEQETIIQGAYPLSGTLTIPQKAEKRLPAILIIPGTGGNDRNGNSKLLRMNLYKDLADFLGQEGYISLRYDKRGTFRSGGDAATAGLWDLIDDAVSCIDHLARLPQADPERIFVLGHSEGAIMAPAIFTRRPVKGLILLSGAAESLKAASARQVEAAMEELSALGGMKGWLIRLFGVPAKARKQNIALMEKILASTEPSIRLKGKKINAKWFREHFAYDMTDYLPQVTCPTLTVTGSKDIQVVPEQARVIAEAVSGPAEWHIVPGMTHILKKTDEELKMLTLIKTYKRLTNVPLDPELLAMMTDWLKRHANADHNESPLSPV